MGRQTQLKALTKLKNAEALNVRATNMGIKNHPVSKKKWSHQGGSMTGAQQYHLEMWDSFVSSIGNKTHTRIFTSIT